MSIAPNKGPYPDPFEDDGKIWAYYNVTTTESATPLVYGKTNDFSAMEIDGVSVPLATSYLFSTTGEHLVKFTPKNNSIAGSVWRSNANPPVKRIYFPSVIERLENGTIYNISSLEGIYNTQHITYLGPATLRITNNNYKVPMKFPSLSSFGTDGSIAFCFGDILDLGSVTSIPAGSFGSGSGGFHALCSKIIIPATVTSIGGNFCWRLYNLRTLIMKPTSPPSLGSGSFNGLTNFVIQVPAESVQAYKDASDWSALANRIQAIPG